MFRNCLLLTLVLVLLPLAATADETEDPPWPQFSAGGLMFGDLYYVASHHTEEGQGALGAVLRRGYLTFDADFSEKMFGRLRFEVNQSGQFETYNFEVDFKDLYVGWNLGRQKLLVGLSPTPTFDLIESIWGSRYLVRTAMDLQGNPSRDTGVVIKGPLNKSSSFGYRVMAGTGVDFGAETHSSPRLMAAVNWKPSPNLIFDVYTDYEEVEGSRDRTTLQGFLGYQDEKFRWGIQYSYQDRQDDAPLELASAFIKARLNTSTQLIGRVDRLFEPSPSGDNISYLPFDPTATATFFVAGVEFQTSPHLFITPNIVWTTYDRNDEGVKPESDLHLRLTLFIDFE